MAARFDRDLAIRVASPSVHLRPHPRSTFVWGLCLGAALFGLLPAIAGGANVAVFTVEVGPEQRVSVQGRSASLRLVIEDICYRAGVEMVFYDAADRPFGGTYHDLPLRELLDRLLHQESYMVETVHVASTQADMVSSLRVLGDPAVAAARRAKGGGAARRRFQVPPALLDTAFGKTTASSTERDTALATMAGRISGDPAQLQGFLATESRLIAETIRRYAGVEEPLRRLQTQYADPRIVHKIDEILAALANAAPAGR